MKVKLKSRYASAKMNAGAGSIIDVPEKEAVELVGGDFAEYCQELRLKLLSPNPSKKNRSIKLKNLSPPLINLENPKSKELTCSGK